MTTAWYWHLRYKEVPLLLRHPAQLGAWPSSNIAWRCPPIAAAAPVYNPAQLKTIQEVVTLTSSSRCSQPVYLRHPLTWSQGFGFALIAAGAFFVFHRF